jgi:hypothetical protein
MHDLDLNQTTKRIVTNGKLHIHPKLGIDLTERANTRRGEADRSQCGEVARTLAQSLITTLAAPGDKGRFLLRSVAACQYSRSYAQHH